MKSLGHNRELRQTLSYLCFDLSPLVEVTGIEQGAETDTQLSLDSAVRFEHVRTYEFLVENNLKTKPSVQFSVFFSFICFDLSPLVEVTGRDQGAETDTQHSLCCSLSTS